MALTIRKCAYSLGAEITGTNISKPLDDKTFNEINRAFLEHHVLVFRRQPLTRAQHVAFGGRFGNLDKNEAKAAHRKTLEFPEILLVISKPKPTGEAATGRFSGQEWHTDNWHLPAAAAAAASLLRSVEVPLAGGDTMFCNMYRAYETLSRTTVNGIVSGYAYDGPRE